MEKLVREKVREVILNNLKEFGLVNSNNRFLDSVLDVEEEEYKVSLRKCYNNNYLGYKKIRLFGITNYLNVVRKNNKDVIIYNLKKDDVIINLLNEVKNILNCNEVKLDSECKWCMYFNEEVFYIYIK